ncbi:MAG: cysteine desulfurase [Lachnospiraceae bacterium]|nr:cysteine desulfurase [Lachnospiraceae bacterium]
MSIDNAKTVNEAYLDNAATTRTSDGVARVVEEMMLEEFGNPSSKHTKGFEAQQKIKEATEIIAASLKVQPKEIVFTSGGTESNNMALIGAALAYKRRGNHIIASGFEHASVYNPLLSLEDFGFKIDFAPVDEMGHIKTDELLGMITDQTILVSVMYVNNEVGAVQDIAALSKAIKEKKKDIIFHVDAIQAYGKYRIFPKKEGIDLLSVSGHKIHGPKGSGFLYIADGVRVRPLIFGGGQQKDRRSGTENVPAIVGLGEAVKEIYTDHDAKVKHLYSLKEHFVSRIGEVEGAHLNALEDITPEAVAKTAPHIVSVSFDGIKAEVLLHALEERHVYVSSGSACSSNHPGISGTLKAIGVDKKLLDSTLRFSFSVNTTEAEIDHAIDSLKELVPKYNRFQRR